MALLNKFTVADNPAKYALYKRCRRDEQGEFSSVLQCETENDADEASCRSCQSQY